MDMVDMDMVDTYMVDMDMVDMDMDMVDKGSPQQQKLVHLACRTQ